MRKLSREQRRDIAAIAAKKDEDIDLSEIPEVVDWSGAEIGKFYRPPKKSVTMRLDQDVIDWLKAYGKGYQTKVNFLLRHAMMSAGGIRRSGGRQKQRPRRIRTTNEK
ncbi:MAG TPA: BrnA antitoxin family protein [Terriglobales bacterium]|nr:BrnA antitoxin family protein [Terriglobales bacterium]